jgi:hypothetical protein
MQHASLRARGSLGGGGSHEEAAVKRFLVVCAGSVALATGIALAPMATAATTASQGTASTSHWTSRDVTISAPRHVSFASVSGASSDATSGEHPDLALPVLEPNPSRTAAEQAAAVQSGGRTSGVEALASPQQGTSVGTTEDFPLMNLDTQVADFPTDPDVDVEPPSTQVAAGPGELVEVVNTTLSIWSDTGSEMGSPADLNTFFDVPSGYSFTDPQAMYDAASGLWFVSGWAYNSSSDSDTYLAVSSDPSGSWTFYTVQSNTSSELTDQPMIGVCDDNVVMAWNEYTVSSTATAYDEAVALVLDKADIVADTTVASQEFFNSEEFRLVPARSLSSTATCYMTVNNASVDLPGSTDTPTLGVIAINGTAPSATLSETDLPIAATYAPPEPSQPSGTTNDTLIDDRMLSAVWQDNVLWTSATDACTPPGDTTVRDCMRLDEVSTSGTAPALVQDFDLATSGLDEYYPAVSLDSSGDLFVAYSASSSTQYAGAYAVISPASSVSSFTAPTTIEAGSASYTGRRWGDYSDAAPDPSVAGAVWVSGEYAPSDAAAPDWGTAAAELILPAGYPGVTSADQTTFIEGTAGSFTVTGSGSPTLTETGALPSGVTFSSAGVLSGTPAAGTGGSYPVQITATNTAGAVTQAFTLTVQPSGPLYTPMGPVRVLDTRNGTGAPQAPVGPGGTISLQVEGVDGVPASGVTAVVLNVTATDTTASSYVTVWPDGETQPTASNLNFTAGETIPNLVVVPVGADGKVDFYNHVGSVDLVADLQGYYSTSGTGSAFDSIGPVRVLDTRNGTGGYTGTVGAGQTLFLQVTGVDGVPANGVTAVVLNVTATEPTASSYVTVYPFGETLPTASNLNFTAGETIPNQVIVPVGSFGDLGFYNHVGNVDLVADLAGYYTTTSGGSAFNSIGPVRVLDTRNGTGGFSSPVGAGGTISLQVTGVDGVPATGVTAVVLNVTATGPTASSYVTVYPDGEAQPTASSLNFTAGETIPNLVVVPVGPDGKISFYNHVGTVNLVADLAGYYTN